MKTRMIAVLLIAGGAAGSSQGGEVIGNTFIGEKNGTIEVVSPGGKWEITDKESKGPNSVADLRLKDSVNGTNPTCNITSLPKIAQAIEMDALAETFRKSMSDAGMELGALESRRYGGKPALVFGTSLTKGAGTAKGDAYVLRGEKDYFFVTCAANATAYDVARPLFEELVGKIKY